MQCPSNKNRFPGSNEIYNFIDPFLVINMSYSATVGGSAANSNLIKLKT